MKKHAKRWGHRSHQSGKRIIRKLAKSNFFNGLVKREKKKYLTKGLTRSRKR